MNSTTDHKSKLEEIIAEILREKSGFELADLDRSTTFLELGFDSLFLIQLSQTIRQRTQVKLTFRQMMEEVTTVDALMAYLATHAPQRPAGSAPENVFVNVAGQANSTAVQHIPDPVTGVGDASRSGTEHVVESVAIPSYAGTSVSNRPDVPTPSVSETVSPPGSPLVDLAIGEELPPVAPHAADGQGTVLQQIILQQTALMSKHLQMLQAVPGAASIAESRSPLFETPAQTEKVEVDSCGLDRATAALSDRGDATCTVSGEQLATQTSSQCDITSSQSPKPQTKHERFGPYKPVRKGKDQGLTKQQRTALGEFISRYTARTRKSQEHAEKHRDHFADPRGVAAYRRIWKSIVYQICAERSKGAKLWDIDGNEYVDIAMGFGLNLFGQSPDFITDAIADQLQRGVQVGPQSALAGEVAQLLCELTKKDRVSFCNTGSEAVMTACRLARTVTGRPKVVFFNKDYHGNFDQVLLRSTNVAGQTRTSPAAPGIPSAFADSAIVVEYGSDQALETIKNHAHEIAAVLVEPVQSANPFLQPREFLHDLRKITRDHDIALVMDEVITGFRAAPGGAQEWYDVWGDIATYGKVLGGGLPIGALAGSKRFMDALDGGTWRYEDSREPSADMTFFAGTFVRHPLAMVAAYQVLTKIKEEGPQLQRRLTAKTTHMVQELNQFFQRECFPIRIAQFASLFRFMFPPDLEYADLLYFHLIDRGVFTRGWGDNCFLSTSHSDEDVRKVVAAVKGACLEIRRGGFLPDNEQPPAQPQQEESQICLRMGKEPIPTSEGQANQANGCMNSSHGDGSIRNNSIGNGAGTGSSSNEVLTEKKKENSQDSLCVLTEIQEQGSRPPVFCMHAADGMSMLYYELSNALGDDQPMYGLTSPGILGEQMPDTVEELAAIYADAIKRQYPEGPCVLIGYCAGGTIALEVAQQLIASGQEVGLLAGIETYNWLDAPSTNATWKVQVYYQLKRFDFHLRNFMLLGIKSKLAFLGSKLSALLGRFHVWKGKLGLPSKKPGLSATGVNLAALWEKHERMAEAYRPKPYPGHMVQFRPRRDYACHLGTEFEALNGVEIVRLRSYPAAAMVSPFVAGLADRIKERIDLIEPLNCRGQGTSTHSVGEILTNQPSARNSEKIQPHHKFA